MKGISARQGMIALAGILFCAPAIGQTPLAPPKDPLSEVVCEKQEVIGSRLQTRRVCMTRAQWADARRQDREFLEQKQTRRGTKGE